MTKDLHPGLGSGALREALAWALEYVRSPEGPDVTAWRFELDKAKLALSLSSPIEPGPRPASERHPNSDRDKLAGEAIRELGAIEAEKPKALKWLIKWDQAKKLHPSQDVCVADLAALMVRPPQASSEIRGAEQLLNEFIGYISVEYQWQQERWENCQKLAKLFLAALSPSRQGAAKRVEG